MIFAGSGKKLGYVPKKDNIVFSRLMDAGKLLIARIKEIEVRGKFNDIKIDIYLVDF
ncbi:MAG: HIRAN domain-containing protein [Firmicutes bacterium]|nr:HIRAN domain-containing protein [Bacillota bacterium]